ncbi:MAG: iron ABC transporter permease [Verrucomicrobia bacterium]|nr:iron ABC transporter permease [Verrucomicrobiota bacterium]
MNRTLLAFGSGLLGLVLLIFVALSVGSAGTGWGDGGGLVLLRTPRILAALAAGLALGIGGAAQQGVFRNPLADPGLTGVFGGALLGIAVLLGATPALAWQRPWIIPLAAFLGALLTSVLLVLISGRGNTARLLITGLGLNAFTAAGTLVIASRSNESRELLTNGAYGDWLGMATLELIWLPCVLCAVASILLLTLSRSFDLLSFGEDSAQANGCNVNRSRRWAVLLTALAAAAATCLVLLTALAAAAATCLVGQVAFIGLLAPHLARGIIGPRHRLMMPLAGLLGGGLLLCADTIGRAAWPQNPLSAAAVMALLGAPLFIWIARRSHE